MLKLFNYYITHELPKFFNNSKQEQPKESEHQNPNFYLYPISTNRIATMTEQERMAYFHFLQAKESSLAKLIFPSQKLLNPSLVYPIRDQQDLQNAPTELHKLEPKPV